MGSQVKTCPEVELRESGSMEVSQKIGGKCMPFFNHKQGNLGAETGVKHIIRKVEGRRHLAEGRT